MEYIFFNVKTDFKSININAFPPLTDSDRTIKDCI